MSIEDLFPGLRTNGFTKTSPATDRYNCIAWAAGDNRRWWWPVRRRYWPPGVPRNETIDAFVRAFAQLGYSATDNAGLEPGIEKVALFALDGAPTHAARQLDNGRWTSKLGDDIDIEHDLDGVAGDVYGSVVRILARVRTN